MIALALAVIAVGPGLDYEEVTDVPFESLAAGDVVEIHWRDTPYAAKFVVGDGVTVRGVRGPGGERPIIDGAGATTRAQLDFWNEDRMVIKVGGSNAPADAPSNVVIEGLDVRGGHPDNSFTDASGAVTPYAGNAAAILIEDGAHVTIRDCELRDSANGLFVSSGSSDVLVEGNDVHDNGVVGDIYVHNSYTEADGIVFQYNHYGSLAPGAGGNNLKDRSQGLVVRYNWIENGNRQLDLVDSDVFAGNAAYATTYVYGNVLVEGDGEGNRQIVHYGGDGADPATYRKGTLYFYGNTVVSTRTDRTTLFRLSTPEETADVRDNVFYAHDVELLAQDGDLDWGWNWMEPGWVDSFAGATGTVTDLGGRIEGSDPGFVDLAGQDFHLTATAAARDTGGALADGVPPLDRMYPGVPRPADATLDMGAYEYCEGGCATVPDAGPGGGGDDAGGGSPDGGCCDSSGGAGAGSVVLVAFVLLGRRRWIAALLLAACSGAAHPKPAPVDRLTPVLDDFTDRYLAMKPGFAVDLGYHQYDGQLPDVTPAGFEREETLLKDTEAALAAIPDDTIEKEIVLAEIHKERFDLEVRRRPWRDPFYYARGYSFLTYVARDYAPLADRARALLAACRAAPAYYQQADANLEHALPKAWLAGATKMLEGTQAFAQNDAKAAFDALDDAPLKADLDGCLDDLAKAIGVFHDALAARMPDATADFALGADGLVAMLHATEGIDLDLPTLQQMAADDLARNQAAIVAAAKEIDPNRPAADVIAEVSADKPDQDHLLDEASDILKQLRAFLDTHAIVSIPRDEVAEPRFSPPFMRGNFAALGGAGPFEKVAQPSYFYIAPPDPTWPPAQQQAYLPSRWDLLFVAAHEVWPGHFVQGMHERASGSRILQTFETYTASEGWAHYVEEMMWDQGFGDGDPRAHIGELKNALLRDVRFVVALGLQTGTMTVDEAVARFQTDAYADPGNAQQQAMRGTADPMYLGYTLGKLMIRKLRDDWLAANPGKSLEDFHDAFLSYAEAPLPVVRRFMGL